MFSSRLTAVSLLTLGASRVALAGPCVAFDIKWNLLAFGLGGKDYNAGTQDTWGGSTTASDITTSGRPPFDGANTTCYLAQYSNAIYVMNGDASDTSAVHIYDATAKSWSKQAVTTGTFDPTSFKAILDHDTNVFYALSKGELFFLDMGALKAANSSALSWTDVGKAGINTDGYDPVMALAQNHIHLIDVPGTPAGSANIFVIHYSWWQPDAQAYPASSGNSFPATHGQATSFFRDDNTVQQEFAFIPDDGSSTYVINVENNSTTPLAGPSTKDAAATYFASPSSLVQLSSSGKVSYLPYKQGDASANSAAAWSPVSVLASVASSSSASSGSHSGSATASATGSKTSGKASGTGASGSMTASGAGASESASAAEGRRVAVGTLAAGLLAALGLLA